MAGQVQLEQGKSGQVKSGLVKSSNTGQDNLEHVKSSRVKSRESDPNFFRSKFVLDLTYTWNSSVALLRPTCFHFEERETFLYSSTGSDYHIHNNCIFSVIPRSNYLLKKYLLLWRMLFHLGTHDRK